MTRTTTALRLSSACYFLDEGLLAFEEEGRKIMELLGRLGKEHRGTIYLMLEPRLNVSISSDLQVKARWRPRTQIRRAVCWQMEDSGHPSRDDTASPEVWASSDDRYDVLGVIEAFATAPIRCKLVLELEDGLEISFYPSLRSDVPAWGEEGYQNFQLPEGEWSWELVASFSPPIS